MKAIIEYKTKVKTVQNTDGTHEEYLVYKKEVGRKDCNLQPHEHTYYNSDLFPGMLRRAYTKAIEGNLWCKLRNLPPSVKVSRGNFLSTVTVEIEL